jgi:hypothetical protein
MYAPLHAIDLQNQKLFTAPSYFYYKLQFHIKPELQLRGSSGPINRVRTVPILICISIPRFHSK